VALKSLFKSFVLTVELYISKFMEYSKKTTKVDVGIVTSILTLFTKETKKLLTKKKM